MGELVGFDLLECECSKSDHGNQQDHFLHDENVTAIFRFAQATWVNNSRRVLRSVQHMTDAPMPLIPAATVVVARDGAHGIEVLMVQRPDSGAFPGFWVFPGGRVDADDADPADPTNVLAAARRAAAREALEETSLTVDFSALAAFAEWRPPLTEVKRFGTWFFLAPAFTGEVTINEGELVGHKWVTPTDGLDHHGRGEWKFAPPTWHTLHTLRSFDSLADAMAWAHDEEPQCYTTRALIVEGEPLTLMWHGDAQYEHDDAPDNGARHRIVMVKGNWVYERNV